MIHNNISIKFLNIISLFNYIFSHTTKSVSKITLPLNRALSLPHLLIDCLVAPLAYVGNRFSWARIRQCQALWKAQVNKKNSQRPSQVSTHNLGGSNGFRPRNTRTQSSEDRNTYLRTGADLAGQVLLASGDYLSGDAHRHWGRSHPLGIDLLRGFRWVSLVWLSCA